MSFFFLSSKIHSSNEIEADLVTFLIFKIRTNVRIIGPAVLTILVPVDAALSLILLEHQLMLNISNINSSDQY